ncbi:MAG: hypothetical protein QM666_10375 [Acinetobacter sp.]
MNLSKPALVRVVRDLQLPSHFLNDIQKNRHVDEIRRMVDALDHLQQHWH